MLIVLEVCLERKAMNKQSYLNYLNDLTGRLFKILPLCEEKNTYIDKYLDSLIVELRGLFKACPELVDSDSAWYVKVLSTLYTFHDDFTIAELHSQEGIQRVRQHVFNMIRLVNKEKEEKDGLL